MQRHADTDLLRSALRSLGVGRPYTFTAKVEMYADDGGRMRARLRDPQVNGAVVTSHCFLYAEDVQGGQAVLDRIGALKGRTISFQGAVKLYPYRNGLAYKLAFHSFT